ncbi:uridine kinase family protein [Plantactinospora sp. WMMB782]|uniref:uridine kinase family protein n=1 Tax=Plantactinospora sp. WMMB782 TaxID=3404121 RepID=UPI003B9330CA
MVESYAGLAARILKRPARLGRTRLVAVDGPSGAGKTVFASRLAAAFEVTVPVVHTDDLLDGWADQFAFWPRLEEWILAPLRAGQPARYRRYDWTRGRFGQDWTVLPPAPVVIVEGVSSARAAIAAEVTLAVFVSAPARLCRDRTLARDGAALVPALTAWRRGERAHFAADRTRERADLVVDGAAGPGRESAAGPGRESAAGPGRESAAGPGRESAAFRRIR